MALTPARGAVMKNRRRSLVRNRAHIWSKEELHQIEEIANSLPSPSPDMDTAILPAPSLRRCKPRMYRHPFSFTFPTVDVSARPVPLPTGTSQHTNGNISMFTTICTTCHHDDELLHSSVSDHSHDSSPNTPDSVSPNSTPSTSGSTDGLISSPALPSSLLPTSLFSTPAMSTVACVSDQLTDLTL